MLKVKTFVVVDPQLISILDLDPETLNDGSGSSPLSNSLKFLMSYYLFDNILFLLATQMFR
jgi:hypothetical protein